MEGGNPFKKFSSLMVYKFVFYDVKKISMRSKFAAFDFSSNISIVRTLLKFNV